MIRIDTKNIASQLLSEKLFLHPSALTSYKMTVHQLLTGEITSELEEKELKMTYLDAEAVESALNSDGSPEEKSVAVIHVIGPIVKFGNRYFWGADEYEWMLDQAYADENISAIILKMHTPGGMVCAMDTLAEVTKRRNKPVIACVSSMCFSAGVYWMVHCDEVHATNADICQLGSIGVMSTITDDRKMLENYGLKEIISIPPESRDKLDAHFKARDGDDSLLIQYELTPLAKHFQKVVKENRPNLKVDTERLLTGGEFFAGDAKEAGLIDKIMPFTDTIAYAHKLAERNDFENQFDV